MLEDAASHECLDCAMIDPGASSFLMGSGPLVRLRITSSSSAMTLPSSTSSDSRELSTLEGATKRSAHGAWTVKIPVYLNAWATWPDSRLRCFR